MKQITKSEAIDLFVEYSKGYFSSFNFVAEDSTFKFKPARSGIVIINIANLLLFALPHVIYFFGHYTNNLLWNDLLYILIVTVCMIMLVFIVSNFPVHEIEINHLTKTVQLTRKDIVGRYFIKKIIVKIGTVKEINEDRIKKKVGEDVYLTLVTNEAIYYRLFAISNWDNVSKMKAAFSTLLFDRECTFDDSKENSVVFDKALKKLLSEKDGETSYIPFTVLIILIIILVIGLLLYFTVTKQKSYYGNIDSLLYLRFKFWAMGMGILAIPIYLAGTTKYQKREKSTKKTITVFSIMAAIGLFFCSYSLTGFLNIKLDGSQPKRAEAIVIDSDYTMGGNSRRGYFTIDLYMTDFPGIVSVTHHDPELHENLKATIPVLIYEGYLNKRWLKIE